MRKLGLLFTLAALGAGACTAVLDIESLEAGPNLETASGGQAAPNGGRTSGGSTDDGGSGPSGGTSDAGGSKAIGGSAAGGAPSSGGSAGSSSELGGEGGAATGAGGEGGAPAAIGAIEGKVIDFWGHPVPNVPVGIGEQTAVTDTDGTFSIPDVTTPYDVSLRIETDRVNYAWVYQGLNRRDPTLQVDAGMESRDATVTFHTTGAMHDDPNVVRMAVGSADGSFALSMSGPDVQSSASWYGPASTMVSGHALWWTESDNDATPGPADFLGYGSTTATFTSGVADDVTIDLGGGAVDSATIQGTVVRTLDYPTDLVSLRFPSNAVIDLLNLTAKGDTFSYKVPLLPGAGAEIVVAASHGNTIFGPYGIAHQVGGSGAVSLTPPEPVTVISPGDGITDVDAETVFQWSERPGVRVLHIEDLERYRGLFVVTDATRITLPEAIGFMLRPGIDHSWTVEVHGTAANVDEACGPEGFLDSYSYYGESPRGPRRDDHGSYSYSAYRLLTTAR